MRTTGGIVAMAVALGVASCGAGADRSRDAGGELSGMDQPSGVDGDLGQARETVGELPLADSRADVGDGERSPATEVTTEMPAGLSPEQSGNEVTPSCPSGMVLVEETFCIDRWEATLEEQGNDGQWIAAAPWYTVGDRTVRAVTAEGLVPQGYMSGAQAAAACEASGKRLCTSEEWLTACRGPAGQVYPYGNEHQAGACNDDCPFHPVVEYFGTTEGIWDAEHMNDPGINQQPGTLSPAGAHPLCVSSWGAFDMHGNLHEWVADAEGSFRGGFYADGSINGPGCTYLTTAHDSAYHDYSTGFRCCLTP